MIRSWLLASILPVVVSALPAQVQVEPDSGGTEEQSRYMEAKRKAIAAGEAGEAKAKAHAEAEAEALANMTPEQRLAHNVINGAGSYCTFETSLEPRRLMPGQTGMLTVMMILRGDAVLPGSPNVVLLSPTEQAPLSVGSIAFRAPRPGALTQYPLWLGKPVYEEVAVFDVPITVASTAKIGARHRVGLDLQFDLYSGTSGQPIGRFTDRAQKEIEIGAAPGRVAVTAPSEPVHAQTAPEAVGSRAQASTRESGQGATLTPLTSGDTIPVSVPDEPAAGAGDVPSESLDAGAESSMLPWLAVGAGALVLIALAMVLRRR